MQEMGWLPRQGLWCGMPSMLLCHPLSFNVSSPSCVLLQPPRRQSLNKNLPELKFSHQHLDSANEGPLIGCARLPIRSSWLGGRAVRLPINSSFSAAQLHHFIIHSPHHLPSSGHSSAWSKSWNRSRLLDILACFESRQILVRIR